VDGDGDGEKRLKWVHDILLTCIPDKDSFLGCMIGKCVGDSLGFFG
jgi:hypothetical protein